MGGSGSGTTLPSSNSASSFDGLTKIGKVPGLNANNPTSGRRDNWAGFAEVRIPLTNPDMDIPVLRSFEITAAGRYEEFDPGGDSAVPKVGVRWQPLDEQFTLRGTYSESFIAPTTYELFGGSAVNVPLIGVPSSIAGNPSLYQEYTSNLSNRELTPSDAKQYGGGLVFSPKGVKGLTLSVDYYNIKTENDIYRVSQQEMVNSINSLGHTDGPEEKAAHALLLAEKTAGRQPEPPQGCGAGSFGLCVSSQRRPSRSRKKSIHT